METKEHTSATTPTESIDFNKLTIIVRKNLIWVVLIFLLINVSTHLILRYWPDEYESHSTIKLDIKNEASDLGIKGFVDESNQNLVSGEIELIRSRMFLTRVLDSINLDVGYYNKGDLMNHEFFGSTPFTVSYTILNPSAYNQSFFVAEQEGNAITVKQGQDGQPITGYYGRPMNLPNVRMIISRNDQFDRKGVALNCFFIIHRQDALLDYLDSHLTVTPLNFNANTIKISFLDANATKVSTIVNTIDSVYLVFSNEQKNQANKQKITWLTNELAQIEDKMGEYENYFENFILENKTNDLDEELRNTISMIYAIDSQRYELNQKIADINQLMEHLTTDTALANIVAQKTFPPPILENLAALQTMRQALDKLSLSYSPITFAYKQREHDLQAKEDELMDQLLELKRAWLEHMRQLGLQKARLENNFAAMPNRNTQFNKKQRFYQLYEEFYLSLMQSKAQFEIAKAGTTPDFKILAPASLSWTPIAPNRLMIRGIGFVASIVVSLFLIGLLYLANNKITSIHELEHHTRLPVLGVIPTSHYAREEGLYVLNHPRSMITEAFRTLRTNLDFFKMSSSLQVIAISSSVSGEGKSFVAMNLGGVIALSNKKVILLDLDMRKIKPGLSDSQAPLPQQGVSTILIRKHTWQECVCNAGLENFDYIPAGPQPPNPSELLMNGEFARWLDELKAHYDYIILDTPPVGLVTDGIMAMRQADISVYIFRANYSKKEFLFNLKRIVRINKFSNITTLLNALPTRTKTYGYGYYEEQGKSNGNRLSSLFKF